MVYFSIPNVSSSIDNPLWACAGYDNNPNVDNLQPLHEGGGLENLDFVVIDE
jgi:hypothetical protein